jgi:hypothetical protein
LFAAARRWLQIIVPLVALALEVNSLPKWAWVLEEADETQLWLGLIIESKLLPVKRVEGLLWEASELVAIFVASRKSASSNLRSTI